MEPTINATPIEQKTSKIQFENALSLFVPLKIGEKRDLIHFYFYPDDQQEKPIIKTQSLKVTREAVINGTEGYEILNCTQHLYVVAKDNGYHIEVEMTERPNGEIWIVKSDYVYPKQLIKGQIHENHGRSFELVGDYELVVDGKRFPCLLITYRLPNGLNKYFVDKDGQPLLKMNYHSKGHNFYEKGSFKRGIEFEGVHYTPIYFSMLSSLLL
jgi:hypothetical protein